VTNNDPYFNSDPDGMADPHQDDPDYQSDVHERVEALTAGLERIAERPHADTCSQMLVEEMSCDCHVAIARKTLDEPCPQRSNS